MQSRTVVLTFLLICSALPASPQVRMLQPVRVPEEVMRQMRTTKVDAAYPPDALKARIQGLVVLRVQITKSGDVEQVQVLGGHPMLTSAAVEAVKQWKYKPYLLNAEPCRVDTAVGLNFTLPLKGLGEGRVEDAPASVEGVVGTVSSTIPPGTPLPQRVRVSSGVSSGLLVTKVNPEYPPDAREQRVQGVVVLQARIDKEGNVVDLQLVSGHPLLAPAAMEAVKQWKYKPYLLNGNPVMVETQIQVNFTLEE
jgi:TonB family protein